MLLPNLNKVRGGDGAKVASDAAFRNSVVNDLIELRAFLQQRQEELSSGGGAMVNQFQGAPDLLQTQKADVVEDFQGAVSASYDAFTSTRFNQLIQIETNSR